MRLLIQFQFGGNNARGEKYISMERPKGKCRKIVISLIISFSSLLIIYLGMSLYFINHFYFGSTINCINVSGKTVNGANEELAAKLKTYTLKLEEQGGVKEEIRGADINLRYDSHNKIQCLKHSQNPFQWFCGLFNKKEYTLPGIISYDEELLKERVNNLSCFNISNIIKPKNPSFKYTNSGYEIIKETKGTMVNKDILYNHVVSAILQGKTTINFNTINCYEHPKYTSNSKEIVATKNILNKYTSSKITYTFDERKEVLDGSTINTWLKVDDNLEIIFDEEKVKKYIATLANTYDTLGKTRDFVTSSGVTIKVSGGDYGFLIDRINEEQDLIANIKDGKTITKEPKYTQTSLYHNVNDIGKTYVEIDLTKQCLWFYKNGSLIVTGNVVTGNISSNHGTPEGIYKLEYKQRGAILRGAGYSSPVSFWMPFNDGIGIHDATWRSVFGGEIYETDGSHGCINAPYAVAETIFNNIDPGTPIICHY